MSEIINLTKEMKARITDKVIRVLFTNHTSQEKRNIHDSRERLNFACPYCGDSTENDRKKRGNIYWNDLYFHCYNCEAHTPLNTFLRDFNVELDDEDRLNVLDYIREHKKTFVSTGTLGFHLFDKIEELAISRDDVMRGFNAFPINEQTYRAYPYLKSRMLHHKLGRFAYDPRRKQLYIFNLSNTGKVVEGPIDALFMKNSIGITGVKKQVIEWNDIPSARYFFDNDISGKSKMIQKIKTGQRVFMWEKFLQDYNIPTKKIKDLNDLVKYEYVHKKNSLSKLDHYFTSDALDIVFL